MRKLLSFVLGAFLMLNLVSTNAFADAAKGQKYYLKFMKPATGMNGAEFARLQTQAGWQELFEGDATKFVEKYSKEYPALQDFLKSDKFPKSMTHIKDFCIEYAVDSGKVPSC
ncbi:hypothetical protein CCAL9344_06555 [Campylobacter sp. RM9344]|uniref:Cytochrome C n=1 Tax=Campylobacter californiensis TaxID=1032243 RepID=A0AAW3ZXA6_9BACT|nr:MULTISPECIES: hypothetical protein [unclassified Campylobacter]MBE2984074.1 hypothetical protein [Campylobacter sp. RM6883]MBE2987102.1 hypothetical protein [Campylobacter sp. RM12919]MBE2988393.1 hypothetical protein [Campylobacter sp. RM12920]MBE2995499.1 hypothetical protein [Campylobacter sp. RM6913]MBE3021955.1 hypothetical protein [Campylobacter sp. 7477a]MBE3029843.1 hypothetical protein [Campylobacter sp. RM9344]